MSNEFWGQIGITVGGWIVLLTTLRNKVSEHGDRILDLEDRGKKLSDEFVPRHEVKAQLDGIERSVNRTEEILRSVLFQRNNPKRSEVR